MKQDIFNEVLETFENDDIKEFAKKCIESAPPYFYEVPASSSLKYHPSYACTVPLGLAKHSVALVRLLNHMFGVESISTQFTSRERDILRVAGIAHDMMKSGTQEEYKHNKYTKFDHPLKAAEFVRKISTLSDVETVLLCSVISTHMGAWNTDKRHPGIVLPKPTDKYQIIVHLADYLASRKDIEMIFDNIPDNISNEDTVKPNVDPKAHIIPFGKYKGMSLGDIYEADKGYLEWAVEHISPGQTVSAIRQLLESVN